MTGLPDIGITKRTTFLVKYAADSAKFYCDVFGFSVWYDNKLSVDERFPPCAPHMAPAHLVIVKAIDPKLGMLGFLSYENYEPDETPDFPQRKSLRLGDSILVFEVPDLDQVYQAARKTNARIVTPPARWTVPGPKGGVIELYSMSLFDENGIYSEIGQSRS